METILLVEGEAEVAAMAREALEEKGYRILNALNAEEAVSVAIGHAEPIHLLVTPVVMPRMSGHDLARQLGTQRPEMKVLYVLAFTLVKGQQQFESGAEPGAPTILKPFTRERLTEKVKEVLAIKPRSPFDRPPDPWRNI
jgi:CheY-like chemotaxis protein